MEDQPSDHNHPNDIMNDIMMQEMKAREAAAKKEGKWTIFMFKLLKILFSFKNHKIKKKQY